MRFQIELERSPRLIPYPVVVTCDHLKPIRSSRQVRIIGGAPSPGVHPLLFEAFEPISEVHLLRCQQRKARIVKLDLSFPWSQSGFAPYTDFLLVKEYLLDEHWRR